MDYFDVRLVLYIFADNDANNDNSLYKWSLG